MSGRVAAGGALALVAGVLLILSLFLSWYVVTVTDQSGSTTASVNFYPGQTVSLSSSSGSSSGTYSTTYAAAGLNDTGDLYTILEGLLIVVAILGIVGGGLLVGSASGSSSRSARAWGEDLVLPVVVFVIIVLVMMPIVQPTALSNDSYHQAGHSSSSGPTASYFGSEVNGTYLATWGPGPGWYVTIVVLVISAVGYGLAITPRRQTGTAEPGGVSQPYRPSAPSPSSGQWNQLGQEPVASPASQLGSPSFPQTPTPPVPVPAATAERYCPVCGQGNSRSSAFCVRCGRPLPPPP